MNSVRLDITANGKTESIEYYCEPNDKKGLELQQLAALINSGKAKAVVIHSSHQEVELPPVTIPEPSPPLRPWGADRP